MQTPTCQSGLKYFLRPENGSQDVWGPTFGPFDEFIQITYDTICVGPNGAIIAYKGDGDGGLWYFNKTYRPGNAETPIPYDMKDANNFAEDLLEHTGFTDVVIWARMIERTPPVSEKETQ